jgi:hypothetical protein
MQRVVVRPDSSEMSSANSSLANLQAVTELSVNIDAEEGAEILKELSELSLLESLMVDSTDEFKFDPGTRVRVCMCHMWERVGLHTVWEEQVYAGSMAGGLLLQA